MLTSQAELARTRGTPVTVASFNAWKTKFEAEMRKLREREADERMRALPPREQSELKKQRTKPTGVFTATPIGLIVQAGNCSSAAKSPRMTAWQSTGRTWTSPSSTGATLRARPTTTIGQIVWSSTIRINRRPVHSVVHPVLPALRPRQPGSTACVASATRASAARCMLRCALLLRPRALNLLSRPSGQAHRSRSRRARLDSPVHTVARPFGSHASR